MNWLTIVIIVVVAGLGIAGLRQGLIRTVFGIAGLIGGIFLAGRYYDELAARIFPSAGFRGPGGIGMGRLRGGSKGLLRSPSPATPSPYSACE